jgi:Protein of unknown function DUF262
MDYRNTELKLDQLVGYFNEEKINLSPVFQRGRVWNLKLRRELIKNILRRRPIPAIFLYKDEAGPKYTYAILDGKQRLESILMFIASDNPALAIPNWHNYIFGDYRRDAGFSIDLKDGRKKIRFTDLTPHEIRDLREYPIPTIEIALNENTTLDEIINLFVDINQYGAKVTRVNIVRAMKREDPLLKDIYGLVAEKQMRRQDVFTRRRRTPFAAVLKRLQIVASVSDANIQADRMWERLFEIALFARSNGTHRKPTEILKTFIKTTKTQEPRLTKQEKANLRKAFEFLQVAYAHSSLGTSRLATDQTHFYTMITSLLTVLLDGPHSQRELRRKLTEFARLISSKQPSDRDVQAYLELSSKQTTDADKRKERQKKFVEIITRL